MFYLVQVSGTIFLSVTSLMCAYDVCADNCSMVEKWFVLELFSRAAFCAGLCYMQAGDIRGAKSMLLYCLKFCEAFRLRKRFYSCHFVS